MKNRSPTLRVEQGRLGPGVGASGLARLEVENKQPALVVDGRKRGRKRRRTTSERKWNDCRRQVEGMVPWICVWWRVRECQSVMVLDEEKAIVGGGCGLRAYCAGSLPSGEKECCFGRTGK